MFEFIECFIRVASVLLEKLNDFFHVMQMFLEILYNKTSVIRYLSCRWSLGAQITSVCVSIVYINYYNIAESS